MSRVICEHKTIVTYDKVDLRAKVELEPFVAHEVVHLYGL
jgi:hypothetical protein